MDLLDGYLATKYGQGSDFGALFDIAVDRIVELSFFFCFANLRLIPLWVPLLLLTRGILVDVIRCHGAGKGFVGWGSKSLIKIKYLSFVVNSVLFRALDGLKAVSIGFFAFYLLIKDFVSISGVTVFDSLLNWTHILAWLFLIIFVIVNLARGVPYLVEFGRIEKKPAK